MNTFIITEYNPFHYGHLYQINQIPGPLAVMMSGDITQRGEPAILDKYVRAKHAVLHGVDLVIEMPVIYSLQSAENFAYGPLRTLLACNIFDQIAFSSESKLTDLMTLMKIRQESTYQKQVEHYLNQKFSLEEAHRKALLNLNLDPTLLKSNNILALAYLEALERLDAKVKILQIDRIGSDYSSENFDEKILSASAIRYGLKNKKNLAGKVPPLVLKDLKNTSFYSLYPYFQYKLFIEQSPLCSITGYEQGMEGLFLKNIQLNEEDFYQSVTSRRYRLNRIKRLIANYLLNIQHGLIDQALTLEPKYIKILAFNEKGRYMLQEIKKRSDLKVITNHRQIQKLDDFSQNLIRLDQEASFLAHRKVNDYYGSQYIKP